MAEVVENWKKYTPSQHNTWCSQGSVEAQNWCKDIIRSYHKKGKIIKLASTGCELIDLVPTKKSGYVQLPWKSGKTITAHQASLISVGRLQPDSSLQASHRCDQTRCIKPSHLLWESTKDNNKRKGCIGQVRCPCGNVIVVCTHGTTDDTRCIRP